jgi:hypothetical protein
MNTIRIIDEPSFVISALIIIVLFLLGLISRKRAISYRELVKRVPNNGKIVVSIKDTGGQYYAYTARPLIEGKVGKPIRFYHSRLLNEGPYVRNGEMLSRCDR